MVNPFTLVPSKWKDDDIIEFAKAIEYLDVSHYPTITMKIENKICSGLAGLANARFKSIKILGNKIYKKDICDIILDISFFKGLNHRQINVLYEHIEFDYKERFKQMIDTLL